MSGRVKIRLLSNKSEHVVDGNLQTVHRPKGLSPKLGCVVYDREQRRIIFQSDTGSECWTPDGIQPLNSRSVAEDFCVWNGAQVDSQGRPIFWLAERVSWDTPA